MKLKSEKEVAGSCRTLRNPMDCSLPGSSFHGIFQARVLEWGAIAFSNYFTFIATCPINSASPAASFEYFQCVLSQGDPDKVLQSPPDLPGIKLVFRMAECCMPSFLSGLLSTVSHLLNWTQRSWASSCSLEILHVLSS